MPASRAPREGKSKLKPWKSLPAKTAALISGGVHFYAKATNSNAGRVGVRIDARTPFLQFPWVGLQTSKMDLRRQTYTSGGPNIGPFNQILNILEDRQDEYEAIPPDELNKARELIQHLDPGGIAGADDPVDPRLPQVLMPLAVDADGKVCESEGHVSITPMHSVPFAREISVRRKTLRESRPKEHRVIEPATVTIYPGGSHQKNVGRYASELGRVMLFAAPVERHDMKSAYALLAGRFKLTDLISERLLTDFATAWRADEHGRDLKRGRDREEAFAKRLVTQVLNAAEARLQRALDSIGRASVDDLANALQNKTSLMLVPNELIAKLSGFQLGLLDKRWRTKEWKRDFSRELTTRIRLLKLPDGSHLASSDDLIRFEAVLQRLPI